MINMNHMKYLEDVMKQDIATLQHKEATYRGSWKKRGGVGAYMMAARKIDRLENIATNYAYDIFKALEADMVGVDGSALAELRDLRQYLALIEAEMLARMAGPTTSRLLDELFLQGTPDDGAQHTSFESEHLNKTKNTSDY